MTICVLLAMGIEILGALLVYAGAYHQRLSTGERARPKLRWLGSALLIVALAILFGQLSIPTAIFTWTAIIMLIWSVIPLAVAWRDWRQKGFE